MSSNRIKPILASSFAILVAFAALLSSTQAATLSKFTGGDPGEGLDLKDDQGGFVYALNFRATSGTNNLVGDVTFNSTTASSAPVGVTVVGYSSPFDHLTAIGAAGPFEFGSTSNDNNLEVVMDSGVFAGAAAQSTGPFQLRLAVTPGRLYKLQLLMFDSGGAHRPANYAIDAAGTTFIDIPSDPTSYPSASYVVTEFFTATNASENITITWTGASGSNASIIHGLTLEFIPEPATLTLLAISGLLFVMSRTS